MRRLFPIIAILLMLSPAFAQFSNPPIRSGSSDPATCSVTPGLGENALFYNTTSKVFKYCSATNVWTAFAAAGPAFPGSTLDTQVLFNDGGAFGGDAHLLWNKATQLLTLNTEDVEVVGGGLQMTDTTHGDFAFLGPGFMDANRFLDFVNNNAAATADITIRSVPGDANETGTFTAVRVSADATVAVGRTTAGVAGFEVDQWGKTAAGGTLTQADGLHIKSPVNLASGDGAAAIRIDAIATDANKKAVSIAGGNSDLGPDTTTIGKLAKLTNYNATTLTGDGVPYIVVNDDQTAQGAALSAVSLIASVPATGMYEVTWVASVTTVGDVSSVLGGGTGFQVIYTSPTDSVAKTSNPTTITAGTSAGNTTATTVGGTVVAYCKVGTALQYSFGYTSVNAGVMKYEIHVKAKAMGN